MSFLLLQNYAHSFVFAVVMFFGHVWKEHLVTFFDITHQRPRFINTAQIVIRYVAAIYFPATCAALRTLKRALCGGLCNHAVRLHMYTVMYGWTFAFVALTPLDAVVKL
jgi:hypothetical protein